MGKTSNRWGKAPNRRGKCHNQKSKNINYQIETFDFLKNKLLDKTASNMVYDKIDLDVSVYSSRIYYVSIKTNKETVNRKIVITK